MSAIKHPLIAGLVAELPEPGTVWRAEDQAVWFKACSAIFDLIYREPDGRADTIEVMVEPQADWRAPAREAVPRIAAAASVAPPAPVAAQPAPKHEAPRKAASSEPSARDALLRRLWAEGVPTKEIGARCGLKRDSAKIALRRLDLPARFGARGVMLPFFTPLPSGASDEAVMRHIEACRARTAKAEAAPAPAADPARVKCAGCRISFVPHGGSEFCAECRRFDPGAKASSAVAPAPVRKRSGPPPGFLPRKWSAEEDETLRQLWGTSLSAAGIAKQLKRGETAIMARAESLGLPGRKGRTLTDDVAEHIAKHGVTRLPTAAVLPTSAEISDADRAAVAKHNEALEAARVEQNQRGRGRPAAAT